MPMDTWYIAKADSLLVEQEVTGSIPVGSTPKDPCK
jgi:hypothetical protein